MMPHHVFAPPPAPSWHSPLAAVLLLPSSAPPLLLLSSTLLLLPLSPSLLLLLHAPASVHPFCVASLHNCYAVVHAFLLEVICSYE
jgi:hypothetical protein